jgi:putative transposase
MGKSMSELYKNRYRTSSARLAGFDYSKEGYYFVTICVRYFQAVFGEITDQKIKYTKAAEIVDQTWKEIPTAFPNAKTDEFIIMPDHFHGIIKIVYPEGDKQHFILNQKRKTESLVQPDSPKDFNNKGGGITGDKNPMLSCHSLSKIIRWFKGSTTYKIRKAIDPEFEWQNRFWDRIIWNERQLDIIRKYIRNNPMKWKP